MVNRLKSQLPRIMSLVFVVSLFSCRSEENVWDDLTDDERRTIQSLSVTECLSETASRYANYKSSSQQMWSSGDWEVNDGWVYKLEGDEAVTIRVKNLTSSAIYLYTEQGLTTPVYRHIKIDKTENEKIIESLQYYECIKISKVTGGSSSPFTQNIERSDSTYKYSTNYTFNLNEVAFLSFWRKSVTKTPATGSMTTVTSTLTSLTNASFTPSASAVYCLPKKTVPSTYTDPVTGVVFNFDYRFPLELDLTGCSATEPVGW